MVHVNEGSDGTLEWIKHNRILIIPMALRILVYAILQLCKTPEYLPLYLWHWMMICTRMRNGMQLCMKKLQRIGHKYFCFGTAIEPLPQSNCAIGKDYGTGIEILGICFVEGVCHFAMSDWQGATWPPDNGAY